MRPGSLTCESIPEEVPAWAALVSSLRARGSRNKRAAGPDAGNPMKSDRRDIENMIDDRVHEPDRVERRWCQVAPHSHDRERVKVGIDLRKGHIERRNVVFDWPHICDWRDFLLDGLARGATILEDEEADR